MPLKLVDGSENTRVKEAIETQRSASLNETFNAEMYLNPKWKVVEKTKWLDPKGMTYRGQLGSHVMTGRASLLGGSGSMQTSMMANQQRT